ncbi:ABC transporter ATP-binding protein [Mycoplasma sp. CSL10137]|uniref:ABC transporter ATP-binding protein n=1 Tax=unclassified Mycoplasma TaxID=2683645 RepID=UPI00197B1E3B|nr:MULTISPECIES: ABC transporter ATP-binding protein [unclassified Mycoplasma]MBN4083671.1 ABC transporter ATP-binding protein [Mycoplasma sp. CSL10137]MBN4084696.1 ABC transporter ATP-binding protein [Mycoplasma sp. CSL10166]MBU4693174.1 ABC transporter ATP-binding protein [Mycoplasma sp. CSL7491-lung]
MNDNILEVKNLTKIYKSANKEKTGVFSLNFVVKKGSFHAFIGENGSGKTTTIKSIISSYVNYTGEILIDNSNVKNNPTIKSKIGYVPESAIFPKELNTNEYLLYLGCLGSLSKKVVQQKIDYLLEKFEIKSLQYKKPYDFSSGQKKKVLLIQMLLNNPELIILDEPAANLDPTARYQLFNLLKELHSKGTTIFISSHILSEIDKYVDSFTLIHKGKILFNGPKTTNLEKVFYEKVIKN